MLIEIYSNYWWVFSLVLFLLLCDLLLNFLGMQIYLLFGEVGGLTTYLGIDSLAESSSERFLAEGNIRARIKIIFLLFVLSIIIPQAIPLLLRFI